MTHDAVQGSDASHSGGLECRSTLVAVRQVVPATQCQVRNFENVWNKASMSKLKLALGRMTFFFLAGGATPCILTHLDTVLHQLVMKCFPICFPHLHIWVIAPGLPPFLVASHLCNINSKQSSHLEAKNYQFNEQKHLAFDDCAGPLGCSSASSWNSRNQISRTEKKWRADMKKTGKLKQSPRPSLMSLEPPAAMKEPLVGGLNTSEKY